MDSFDEFLNEDDSDDENNRRVREQELRERELRERERLREEAEEEAKEREMSYAGGVLGESGSPLGGLGGGILPGGAGSGRAGALPHPTPQ